MYLNTAEATTHIIRKNSSIEKSSNKKGLTFMVNPFFQPSLVRTQCATERAI